MDKDELTNLANKAYEIKEMLLACSSAAVTDTVKKVLLKGAFDRAMDITNGVCHAFSPEEPKQEPKPKPESKPKPKRSFGKAKCSVCGKDFERKGPRDVKCPACKEAKNCTECKEYGGGTECTLRPAITIDDPVKVAGECMTFDRKGKRNGK